MIGALPRCRYGVSTTRITAATAKKHLDIDVSVGVFALSFNYAAVAAAAAQVTRSRAMMIPFI